MEVSKPGVVIPFGFCINAFYDNSLINQDLESVKTDDGLEILRTQPVSDDDLLPAADKESDWNMDDWPYFTYEGNRQGLRSPDDVYGKWAAEFDYLYQKIGSGVYLLIMHPQCMGKGSRMLMLERLIHHMKAHDNVEFQCLATVADKFPLANPIG